MTRKMECELLAAGIIRDGVQVGIRGANSICGWGRSDPRIAEHVYDLVITGRRQNGIVTRMSGLGCKVLS